MIKASDYIARFFVEQGCRHVFMITGGGAMHLNDSFGTCPGLEYICFQHEQAAAIAAEGYYRASGKIPVINVTSGPGGTNTLTGVIGQWLDSIPAIYISGQVKQETTIAACPDLHLRQLGDQEINIVDIMRPVTKYAHMVCTTKEIGYHLSKAYYLATHGRPGPVWLDIPLDIQGASIDEAELISYNGNEDLLHIEDSLWQQQTVELFERIKQAERPVILAGHGIRIAGAADDFLRVVERLGVPVVTAICGHDLIPSDHPLYFGRPGICGDRLGNIVVQNSDLLIAIGARLGIRQISYHYSGFAPDAYHAMVDIDSAELKKPTLRIDMPIHADAKDFLNRMLLVCGETPLVQKTEWLTWCHKSKETLPEIISENVQRKEFINSYEFAEQLFQLLPENSVVVTGNGTAYTGTFQVMKIKKGVRVFANQACASMGYDIPAAIGATIADPTKKIVVITGDGSIQLNIQELQTIAAYRLPIKIFVLNNDGYLAIRTTQDTYFEGRHIGSDRSGKLFLPDTQKIANAFGIPSRRLSGKDSLSSAIEEILRIPGPILCEIMMDPKQTLYPKLSSTMGSDGKMISSSLENMFPFLDPKLYQSHIVKKK
jgi:acetolactate synthase I/II/III large subunit